MQIYVEGVLAFLCGIRTQCALWLAKTHRNIFLFYPCVSD